jgi:hypothetical protein
MARDQAVLDAAYTIYRAFQVRFNSEAPPRERFDLLLMQHEDTSDGTRMLPMPFIEAALEAAEAIVSPNASSADRSGV